jgi:hypothetical protein
LQKESGVRIQQARRTGLRRAAALAVLAVLGACAGDTVRTTTPEKPDTGQWKFERRPDPITGAQVTTAWLHISRYQFLGESYEGELQLACFKTRPVIRLAFNLKVGSDRTAALAYRFDENKGRFAKAKFFSREKIILIDNKEEVTEFVDQLRSAQILFLRVTRLRAGTFTAKFPVHGASHAIDAAFAECQVNEKPIPRTS